MKKRQVVATYGRHKQRVVSVDLWSSADQVFGSSSDSFASNNTSGHSTRSGSDSFSWLGAKDKPKTTKAYHTRRNNTTKVNYDLSADSSLIDGSSNTKNTRVKRQVLSDKSNNTAGNQSRKDKVTTTRRKVKKKTESTETKATVTKANVTKATTRKKKKPDEHDASETDYVSSKVATSVDSGRTSKTKYDFSDIENFSLVISDSPPIEIVPVDEPEPAKVKDKGQHQKVDGSKTKVSIGGSSNSIHSRGGSSHSRGGSSNSRGGSSTPLLKTNHPFNNTDKSHSKGFTSTPHFNSAQALMVNIRRRKPGNDGLTRRKISTPKIESDHSADMLCDGDMSDCIERLDELHVSGVSSIGTSPQVFSEMNSLHDISDVLTRDIGLLTHGRPNESVTPLSRFGSFIKQRTPLTSSGKRRNNTRNSKQLTVQMDGSCRVLLEKLSSIDNNDTSGKCSSVFMPVISPRSCSTNSLSSKVACSNHDNSRITQEKSGFMRTCSGCTVDDQSNDSGSYHTADATSVIDQPRNESTRCLLHPIGAGDNRELRNSTYTLKTLEQSASIDPSQDLFESITNNISGEYPSQITKSCWNDRCPQYHVTKTDRCPQYHVTKSKEESLTENNQTIRSLQEVSKRLQQLSGSFHTAMTHTETSLQSDISHNASVSIQEASDEEFIEETGISEEDIYSTGNGSCSEEEEAELTEDGSGSDSLIDDLSHISEEEEEDSDNSVLYSVVTIDDDTNISPDHCGETVNQFNTEESNSEDEREHKDKDVGRTNGYNDTHWDSCHGDKQLHSNQVLKDCTDCLNRNNHCETGQISKPTDINQLTSKQTDSSQLTSKQTDSSQLTSKQTDSSQLTSKQTDSSQLTSKQTDSSQLTSIQNNRVIVKSSQENIDSHKKINQSDHLEQSSLKTPLKVNISVGSELREARLSFKVLTPVRDSKSGDLLSSQQKVLVTCGQDNTKTFNQAIPPLIMGKCVKIGEGVYGEVFKTERNKRSVALKIIPIEGDFEVNDEPQKSFKDMLPEIIISKELSNLRETGDNMTSSFVQVLGVSVLEGQYPAHLLRQWDHYNRTYGSENDRPDMFPTSQLFIMFEFEECGKDLEGYQFGCISEAKSVIHQVTCSLAVAEVALQFEHRDLHWGNVLVKPTKEKYISFYLGGEEYVVESCGVKVAIIDFTLSRLRKDGCAVYCDLSNDPTLFTGHGDYQFDVYRLMQEENNNGWKDFHGYTNVLWIHYLTDKLIKCKHITNTSSRKHKTITRQLRTFLRETLDYRSALHLFRDCSFFND